MVGGIILVYFTVIVVIGNQAVAYDTHRIQVDDLAGVASKQSDRWQKSEASDHQQSDSIDNVDSGKKGYNIKRGEKAAKKGHHDKKHNGAKFKTKKGHIKSHNNDSGYHEKTKRGKSGKKGFEYNEEGSFRKGHSTKGKHVIHKLNEFENKKKFFDEDYDHEFDEKYDDFYVGNGSKQGRTFKRGHQEDLFQQSGRLGKGFTKNSKDSRNESGKRGNSGNYGRNNRHRKTERSRGHKKGKNDKKNVTD